MLIVVDDPADWPLDIDGLRVVTGESYITDETFQSRDLRGAKVFNCCRSYRYQSIGYYVSLLAEARGHKPLPTVTTIQDLKSRAILRIQAGDLDDQVQKVLKPLKSDSFTLSIYFGRNMAARYDTLCRRLYRLYPSPFLRARFARQAADAGHWVLTSIRAVALKDVPPEHWDFVRTAATDFFAGKVPRARQKRYRFDMAMLVDPADDEPPSDEKALQLFTRAAEAVGFRVERITKDDYGRLAEFDALFIRDTTAVQHHTYRFARRAAAEGLVVIDDPVSIFRCCNKVYLAELLQRHGIGAPRSMVVHRHNLADVAATLGLPCILKAPDSSFSQGVRKAATGDELQAHGGAMLEKSDLIVAQEFVPTQYDWRIGVLDRQPLYAARYHMAPEHWQIIKRDTAGEWLADGRVETVPVDLAPKPVVRAALRAANLIGDGFYGVDLKQDGKRTLVIEVNDNPSIDHGYEDRVLGRGLYDRVMQVFGQRVEAARRRLDGGGNGE